MKKNCLLLLVLIMIFTLASCKAQEAKLMLADDFWSYVDGSTATIPISEALYQHFNSQGEIAHNRTYDAYQNLLSGKARLIFVLEPSADILQQFADANVEIEIIPIVKDAFVLFVNNNNIIQSLSVSQLRDIYTGRIVNWKAVGGEDLTIIPYQRNESAGSQALFMMLLMGDEKPLTPPLEYLQTSMKDIIDSVAVADRGRAAIGFNVYYYANIMYENENIRLLQVDGVNPSYETIMGNEYPLYTYYYAVVRKDTAPDSAERQLIDFILTDDGQMLMQEAGYVPVRAIELYNK